VPTEAAVVVEEEETEAPAADTEGSRLQTVLDRGNLICGVNGGLAGFSVQVPDGSYTGFDVDFCRAVAAALFNNPEAVEFMPLSSQERFTADLCQPVPGSEMNEVELRRS
jgi:general L-amino acid transport system substrate-binding protein